MHRIAFFKFNSVKNCGKQQDIECIKKKLFFWDSTNLPINVEESKNKFVGASIMINQAMKSILFQVIEK